MKTNPVQIALYIAIAILLLSILTGCTPAPCVRPVVDLPPPVLPTISRNALACVSKDTYTALATRDATLQAALRECRAVVTELTETPDAD